MTGPQEWARCRPWIEEALTYALGTHTIEDVEEAIAAGEAHFWPGKQSAVITEFHTFPRLTALHFWLAGGDMSELLNDMRPVIEEWGRAAGATRFTIAGRPGWPRAMKPHGYEPRWSICAKELS